MIKIPNSWKRPDSAPYFDHHQYDRLYLDTLSAFEVLENSLERLMNYAQPFVHDAQLLQASVYYRVAMQQFDNFKTILDNHNVSLFKPQDHE